MTTCLLASASPAPAAGPGASPLAKEEARRWKEQGRLAGEKAPNSEEEAACYRRAVELDPSYADAWFNLAYVHQSHGRLAEAGDAYRKCLEADPTIAVAHYNLGLILLQDPTQLYAARKALATFLELCDCGKCGSDVSLVPQAKDAVTELETRISAHYGEVPDYTDSAPEVIARQLQTRLKRGRSPYQGPRIPMSIHFDTGSSTILPATVPILERVAQALKDPSLNSVSIMIEGHADSRGTSELNRKLSQERADSVAGYLRERLGVTNVTLITRGHGSDRPLLPNRGEPEWQKNRRVEFINETEHTRMRQESASGAGGTKRGGLAASFFDTLY